MEFNYDRPEPDDYCDEPNEPWAGMLAVFILSAFIFWALYLIMRD